MEDRTGFGNFVEDDLKQYLKETSEQVAVSSEEERAVLVENVLEELQGKEMKVATDAECSRMFETILAASTDVSIIDVLDRLSLRDKIGRAHV